MNVTYFKLPLRGKNWMRRWRRRQRKIEEWLRRMSSLEDPGVLLGRTVLEKPILIRNGDRVTLEFKAELE